MIESNYQLITKYFINDIFNVDDSYYISIYPIGSFIKELTLPIKKEQISLIKKNNDFEIEEKNILVVSIKEVKKIKFTFKDFGKDDEATDLGFEKSFFCLSKGELIEIIPKDY